VIPNKVPVAFAARQLELESTPVLPLRIPAGNALLGDAVLDPARAAQTLAGIPRWREDDKVLARIVTEGLPGNGFAPAVATYSPAQWKALQTDLAGH
jgi:hypothetical protein